ncbi:hypothetical protein FP744_10004921 [Trichoderma asperellum]
MFSWPMLGMFAQILSAGALPTQDEDLSIYVNPFIGTAGPDGTGANSGDTFPGVSVPFGVVKIGPDTTEMNPSTNAFAGYTPDGNGSEYKIYFCNDFDTTPSSWRYFSGPWNAPDKPPSPSTPVTWGNASTNPNGVQGGPDGDDNGDRVGAVFNFPAKTAVVKSKTGVSFISVEKACAFQKEIPSWTLNDTVKTTKKIWNDDVFSKISIKEPSRNETRLTLFYSALYRMHQMPSDRSGENPIWHSTEPYYDDYYTLWDTFRCLNSFYLLVQPQRGVGMIRSLIDIWRHVGFMPDGRSGNHNGKVQGGSNTDNVLADAYVKGFKDGINWNDGYKAVWTDAEVVPPPNNDPEDATCADNQGRCGLPDWINLGYVSTTFSSSISRTVEYSLNDFSELENLWNSAINQYRTSGFLGPRYPNGTMITIGPQDESYTTEGLPWEYTWTVPFDMQSLIEKMGGVDATEKRLDLMFVPNLRTTDLGVGVGSGTTLFNPGNEPSFSTPFLYNYLPGRQYKAVNQSRVNIDENYFAGSIGLPGNSDAGAMDSWMLWQMLGLYPVVTQPVYLILAPWFEHISVSVGGSYTLRIKAQGLSNSSFFVQSLKVNGKPWNKSWLEHSDIAKGGLLEFVLGSEPNSWDTGDVPPSPGHQ